MTVIDRSIRLGARRWWRMIGLGLVLGLMATSPLAAVDFDPAFDANVLRFGTARAIQVQGDGKVIVGGLFSHTHGMVSTGNLARYNADGTLDTAFRTAMGTGANDWIYAAAIQTDGKILIAGQFTTFNGVARNRMARLNADGSLDTTFDPGVGPNNAILALAVQTDGKIIVGGAFTSVSGTTRNRVARFNANGTHDTGFNPGSGANGTVWDIALQSDGKPVIVGAFTSVGGSTRNRIARLTTAGALDSITFGTSGAGANNDIYGVEIDGTGRFLIGGSFTSYNGTARNRIARLLTTGLIDTTFATGTAFGSYSGTWVVDVRLDSAGRVLVAGQFSSYDDYSGINSNGLPGIIRLTATGARDTTFNPADTNKNIEDQSPQTLAVVAGDAVLVGGFFADTVIGRGGLTRLTANGTRDAGFDIGSGLLAQPYVEVSAGLNGKFYLFGRFDWAGGAMRANVARFLPNGRIDPAFALQGYFGDAYFDNTVHELVELPDGDLWVFGSFTRYSGLTRAGALRFSSTGSVEFDSLANELKVQGGYVRRAAVDASGNLVLAGSFTMINDMARAGVARVTKGTGNALLLDGTFAPGSGPAGGEVWDVALDSQGRVLLAGTFTAFSGTTETGLVRLSAGGALDAGYATNVNLNGGVNSLAVVAGDKVLIGGAFTTSGGFGVNRFDRLNADGTSDGTFTPGTAANGEVSKIIADASGRPVIAGGFSAVRDETRYGVARLGVNGTADPLLASDQILPIGGIYSLLELPDGKLLAGGSLHSVNGQHRSAVARFHPVSVRRGDLVSTLTGATLANGEVRGVLPLSDGKFLLAGDFTSVSGVARNRLAKIDANGVVDPSFVIGTGANAAVNGALLQPDGKIVVYGAFTTFNNASAPFLLRFNADGTRDNTFTPAAPSGEVRALVRLDNGQYLIAGAFANLGGVAVGRVARLNADGTRDATFTAGTGADGIVHALVRAADGSLFLGGAFLNFAGTAAPGVVKLNADGSRAGGFSIGTGIAAANQPVRTLQLQANGQLVVGGEFVTFAGVTTGPLVRLNADGSRDPAYLPAGPADGSVLTMTRLAMGHLAVAGTFTTLGGGERRGFAVLDDDGRINPYFDVGTGFNQAVLGLTQLTDGRLAAVGTFTTVSGAARNRFALLYASYAAPPGGGGELQTFEVDPGVELTLTSGATDPTFGYQWFKDGVAIPGATASSYTIDSPGLTDAGTYTTRISNGAGELLTAGTRIIVRLAPVVATAPAAQAVGYGAGAEFSVGVSGPGPFTYQWYRDGELIEGATDSTYSLASVSPADFGATFSVRITNSYGTTETTAVAVTFDPTAVPGSVSKGFTLNITPAIVAPSAVVRTADGKFYIGGSGYLYRINADGSRDTTFTHGLGASPTVRALAIQGDGNLLVGGYLTVGGGVVGVARLLPGGALDPAFTPAAVLRGSSSYEYAAETIFALAVQADGKILVGGDFRRVAGTERWHLARLNSNGTLDTGFVTHSVVDANNVVTTRNGPDAPVRTIILQGTTILIAGDFTFYKNTAVGRLVGLTSANVIVTSGFTAGGTRANGAVTSFVAQPDGKLLIGGAFTSYGGTARNGLARLNADGSLDTTFTPGSGPKLSRTFDTPAVSGIGVLPDGGIIVVGFWDSFSGWPSVNAARLSATGAYDTQWAVPLPVASNGYNGGGFSAVLALPDGRALVTGYFGSRLARLEGGSFPPEAPSFLSAPRSLSTSYAAGARVELSALATGPGVMTYQWLRDGSEISGATAPTLVMRSIRASEAGNYALRATSSTTGAVTSAALAVAVQPEATGPGSLDVTWALDTVPVLGRFAVHGADGSVYVMASATGGQDRAFIYKFDANGVLLPSATYDVGTGLQSMPRTLVAQSDGKVVAGGYFSDANGAARTGLARFNANGALDTAYNPAVTGGDVWTLALQADGKLLVGGSFTNLAGAARVAVGRLLTTGAIDTTFTTGAHGLSRVERLLVAADGKVILLGRGTVSGQSDVVRLNANGTLDATFARVSAAAINDVALDGAGRVIVVGQFTSIGGQNLRNVARIGTTGVVDSNFGPVRSAGAESEIDRVAVGADGYTYLVGTSLNTYDGFPNDWLARLDANGKLDVNFPASSDVVFHGNSVETMAFVGGKLVLSGPGNLIGPQSTVVRVNLGVLPVTPPVLVESSGNRVIAEGVSLNLSGRFTGSSTLVYEWRKDGTLLPGAASAQLVLTGLAPVDAGTYTLTATNAAGSATATMTVTLLPADPLAPIGGFPLPTGLNGGELQRARRLADGRYLLAGSFTSINGVATRGLARLNADGTIDTAFLAALPIAATGSISITETHVLPDGKTLLLGTIPLTGGTTAYLVRLTATGALDATLIASTQSNNVPQRMAVQTDGRIVIAGGFNTLFGAARNFLARLNTNGTLDADYAPLGMSNASVSAMALDDSGRVLLAGYFGTIGGVPASGRLVRLTATGTLDPTFICPVTQTPNGLFRASDGRWYAYGSSELARLGGVGVTMIRFDDTGAIDPAFAGPAQGVYAVSEDEHGRLVVLSTGRLMRLLPGGGVDRAIDVGSATSILGAADRLLLLSRYPTTSVGGVAVPGLTYLNVGPLDALSVASSPAALTTASEGARVILRGDFRGSQGATLQWKKNGEPVAGQTTTALVFNAVTPADAGSYVLVASRDGSEVATAVGVLNVMANLARSGDVDLTWGAAGIDVSNFVSTAADAAGNLFFAGSVNMPGVSGVPVVAFDPAGVRRTDFVLSPRLTGLVSGVLPLPDGKLLVYGSGSSMRLDVTTAVSLLRLEANGAIDPTFTPGVPKSGGYDGSVSRVTRLADGRLLVAGSFDTFNTQAATGIARLSADGVADTTFAAASYAGSGVSDILPAADGKWWITGSLNELAAGNYATRFFMRLNADGTRDLNFAGPVRTSAESPRGFAGLNGEFYLAISYSDHPLNVYHVRRVTAQGGFDATFKPPLLTRNDGNQASVNQVHVDAQGRLWLAGGFDRVNGVPRDGVARLLADGSLDPSFVPAARTSGGSIAPVGLHVLADRVILTTGNLQYGGVDNRSGAVALVVTELPATTAPVLAGDLVNATLPAYRGVAYGLPVYAPADAAVQWYRNGTALAGSTGLTLRMAAPSKSDNGDYHATVTTAGGSVTTGTLQLAFAETEYSGGLSLRNGAAEIFGVTRFAVKQPDGKILVLSDGAFVNGAGPFQLFRLNADGTFAGGLPTMLTVSPSGRSTGMAYAQRAVVDADGRIYVGGDFTSIDGVTRNKVARLLADGTVDPTWNAQAGPNSRVDILALQTDGKLLIAGQFTQVAGTARKYIARLNTDGSLDSTFATPGTGFDSLIHALQVQPDGHILVGGAFSTFNAIGAARLARLDPTGALDPTYTASANNFVRDIALFADGRMAIAGQFTQVNATARSQLAVLSANGTLEPTAFPAMATERAVAVAADGTLYAVGGGTNPPGGAVGRYPGGTTVDTLFNSATTARGLFGGSQPLTVIPVEDEVLVAGPFNTVGSVPRWGLIWLSTTANDGGPIIATPPVSQSVLAGRSVTFAPVVTSPGGTLTYAWNKVGDPTVLSTGINYIIPNASTTTAGSYRFVVSNGAGTAEAIATVTLTSSAPSTPGMVRPDFYSTLGSFGQILAAPDGTLLHRSSSAITRINPATGASLGAAYPLALTGGSLAGASFDTTGRLYVWGSFTAVNGHASNRVARFTAAKVVDASFVSALPGTSGSINALAALPSGGVYVGGSFSGFEVAGRSTQNLVRLTETGAIDQAFDPAGGVEGLVSSLQLQPDGRLVIGGNNLIAVGGLPRAGLARVLATGAVDPAFNNIAITDVRQLHRYEDGRWLIAHRSQTVDGLARPGLVRLTADGVVDPAFVLDSSALDYVMAFALRPDGRIVAVGSLSVNFNTLYRVAQFFADGSSDASFDGAREFYNVSGQNTNLGSLSEVFALDDGDLLVSGGFTRIGADINRPNLARLHGSPLAPRIVTAPAAQTVAGGDPAALTVSVSGTPDFTYVWRRNGEVVDGASTATLEFEAVTPANAGDYAVTITNAVGAVTTPPVTLTVTQEVQTITFAALPDVVLPSGPLTLDATSDSGLPVALTLVEGPASLDENILTLTGPGTVTIRATQAGNAAYLPATAVERTFVVSEAMTGFEAWQETHFTVGERADPVISGPNAIYGQDGLPNLVKYALGLNPKVNATAGLPELSVTGTHWVYTYTRPVARSDLSYQVELSTNLTTWSTGGVVHELVATEGDTQTWRASYPLASAANAYFRLRVQQVE